MKLKWVLSLPVTLIATNAFAEININRSFSCKVAQTNYQSLQVGAVLGDHPSTTTINIKQTMVNLGKFYAINPDGTKSNDWLYLGILPLVSSTNEGDRYYIVDRFSKTAGEVLVVPASASTLTVKFSRIHADGTAESLVASCQ